MINRNKELVEMELKKMNKSMGDSIENAISRVATAFGTGKMHVIENVHILSAMKILYNDAYNKGVEDERKRNGFKGYGKACD